MINAPLRGMKTVQRWGEVAAHQSGLDIVPHPKLSPRLNESTQGRLFHPSMSFGAGGKESTMENIFLRCAGLDVHKESIEACVRRIESRGHLHQQTRHWGTMTGAF